jgi:hypothetical protein
VIGTTARDADAGSNLIPGTEKTYGGALGATKPFPSQPAWHLAGSR